MTDLDFARIESELGITLPSSYRELVRTRGAELAGLTKQIGGETYPWFHPWVFLSPERLIGENLFQRSPDSAAGYSRPGWWQEYFLCGTNNGGDYFCLRLDGSPEVWFLQHESGEVSLRCGSLTEHVEYRLAEYRLERNRDDDADSDAPVTQPGHCPQCGAPIRQGECAVHTGYAAYVAADGGAAGHSAFFCRCPRCQEPLTACPGGNPAWEEVDPTEVQWYIDLSNRG